MRFPVPPLPPTFCFILVVLLFLFSIPKETSLYDCAGDRGKH